MALRSPPGINKLNYACKMSINHIGNQSNTGHYTAMVIDGNNNVREVSDEHFRDIGNYTQLCNEGNNVNGTLSLLFLA